MKTRRRQIVGWIAAGLSTAITCFWAFWGISENFHEGWYYDSLARNLALMFVQYLSVMLIFMGISLVSISRPRVGASIYGLIGVALAFAFKSNWTTLPLIAGALLLLGVLYWFGRPHPRKLAYALIAGLPLITLIISGVYPAYLVATRFDDGNLEARLVEGNGVSLKWAPDGPGWPRDGVSWQEAMRRCKCLSEDGKSLEASDQNFWRLPTVEEAVRSLTRRGENGGGVWDAASAKASYRITPNKESPLWNVHSKVIYWWTSTPANERKTYTVVYNGQVWQRDNQMRPGYLGFRCVKNTEPPAGLDTP